jgi:MFS family permease
MSSTAFPAPLAREVEVMGLIGLAHGTSHFFHLMLPPLFPWLMREFGLNFTEVGFLMTVFFVVSGLGQALAGFVVDRLGARPVLFFGIGTLAASGVLVGVAASYGGLLAAAAVAGLGNSIFHPADFTLLNHRVSTARLGHAFSVHGLSGNLGWAAAPVFMTAIAAATDWHVAGFAAAGVALAVLALLLARRHVLDEPAVAGLVAAKTASERSDHFGFLRSGAVWLCFVFFFLTTGAFGILQNYGPPILNQVYGISLAWAAWGLSAYLLGSALGMVTGGFVAARLTASDGVIAVALAAAAAVALLLASGTPPAWAVLPAMAVMGFGVGLAGPHRDLLVRKAATARFGTASYGRVYGFVYAGLDLGLAVSPLLFGPLLDAGYFAAALGGVAVLQVAALLSALRVGRGVRQAAAPART